MITQAQIEALELGVHNLRNCAKKQNIEVTLRIFCGQKQFEYCTKKDGEFDGLVYFENNEMIQNYWLTTGMRSKREKRTDFCHLKLVK